MFAFIGMFVAVTLGALMLLSRRVSDRLLIGWGLGGSGLALVMACLVLRDRKPSFGMFVLVCLILIAVCFLSSSVGYQSMAAVKHRQQQYDVVTGKNASCGIQVWHCVVVSRCKDGGFWRTFFFGGVCSLSVSLTTWRLIDKLVRRV